MAEEENIVAELHGHFDQMVRSTLAGGLGLAEQRARRRQSEAEAERAMAAEAARQLQARKRAEREAMALAAQLSITQRAEERAADDDQAIGEDLEVSWLDSDPQVPTAYAGAGLGHSVLDLDMDVDTELDLDPDVATELARPFSSTELGR
jgi:multidrug efflux pump subunit AcrA (membrane-fusion protein)